MKFNKWTVALAAAGLVSIGHNAQAEEGYISALSKTTLSGFVDTSLSLSEQSTGTSIAGRVPYQDASKMNGINLDVIQLSLASPMDESDWAAGYGVDLLFGPDASAYSVGSAGEADDVAVRQAYVNTRVPVGNGLDLKLGVFDAIIGYEGFSNRDNPNYSRNMAYNLQPFNHTGVLAGYQVNDLVGVQFGVANTGSNIVTDRSADTSDVSYMGSVSIEAPDSFGPLAGATLYIAQGHFPTLTVRKISTSVLPFQRPSKDSPSVQHGTTSKMSLVKRVSMLTFTQDMLPIKLLTKCLFMDELNTLMVTQVVTSLARPLPLEA